MEFPLYIVDKEKTVAVVGMIDRSKTSKESGVLIDKKGYIDENEQVWIYSGSGKPINSNEYPYFWLNEKGEKEFSHPDEKVLETYHGDNLKNLSLKVMVKNTNEDDVLYDEQAIDAMNNGADICVETIHDYDDFLKKTLKTVINNKNINTNRLKYKLGEKYALSNMRSALHGTTKTGLPYFLSWSELLGVDFYVIAKDNGSDQLTPLKKPVVYSSRKDQFIDVEDLIEVLINEIKLKHI